MTQVKFKTKRPVKTHGHRGGYSEWCFSCLQGRIKRLEMEKHSVDNLTMLRVVRALMWATATFEFLNSESGINTKPSDELTDAKELLSELERLIE